MTTATTARRTAVRRAAAALAVSAVFGVAAAPAASASTTPPPSAAPLPSGLFGTSDPAYDGVWRQSLALLAQDTAGLTPAGKAVDWLTAQQCADGAFPSYRADVSGPCDAKVLRDSNATAAAVQALTATGGREQAVTKAVGWLKSVQNADGGWSYNPGGASDANSTSVVIGALVAAGAKPEAVTSAKGGKSPYDALLTFARPCGGADGGAFVYQPQMPGAIGDSTAAAVTAAHGRGLAPEAGAATGAGTAAAACDKAAKDLKGAAGNGAAYLTAATAKSGHLLTAPMPGAEDSAPKPDFGNTADAVVALAVQGRTEQARKSLTWLEGNAAAWAKQSGPAAYAQLIFAARAAGGDPKDFGGTDLVAALTATGPTPEPSASASADKNDKKKEEKKDSGPNMWWIVGAFFAASAGAGFLLSGRRKSRS
ncbi:prenyltransferase/squalene oxidase repeat-containing protein [Streptomyces sp. NPDC020875]|uniref:prenyltransferase/squalene oxidase repeat-containing protein n=1 Tax=Streptomyces sp. NPDC020875 TaxID=3154898 RepID=UPI0033DF5460